MDSSRRAVESYWRSRMIDAATSDEDKVTPVYKLEEICELLRSSHISIVKEVSEFILKRLEHKSPIVKQKALRLIKYAVGKSGTEFRREMQRHSVAIRQLFHYKGHVDPLKGDSLNKAVRDTAHEAISAMFSEDNKPAPAGDDLNRRIQGFGNTNYEMPSEDKKSFISEVVGIGSTSIKQGISSFTQSNSLRKNDNGSYRSPNLRRSLTIENDYRDKYEPVEHSSETQGSSGILKNVAGGPWSQDSRITKTETINRDSSSSYTENKTRELRLLETIVTNGGVRLQPTRDAIQVFLSEAEKLDVLALSHALDSKLQSPMWQVRMKAVCVLESVLRKKDDEHFSIVASYFSENTDAVLRCSESPQASLREKANKVLSLLNRQYDGSRVFNTEKSVNGETTTVVQLPNLIDTDDQEDYKGAGDSTNNGQSGQNIKTVATPTTTLIDDLFGDGSDTGASVSEQKNDDDPFADVSFHTSGIREHGNDLFSGMTIDDKQGASENREATNKNGPELFDIFGSDYHLPEEQESNKKDVNDLMDGLSVGEKAPELTKNGTSFGPLSASMFADSNQVSNDALNGILGSQVPGMNANPMFSSNTMPYNIPPGIMFNPVFPSQTMSYGTMGNFIAQQQFLATMSNLQHFGNMNTQNVGGGNVSVTNGGYTSALPDIFQPNFAIPTHISVMNNSKKEETKAFDFISDHVAAARDPKKVA